MTEAAEVQKVEKLPPMKLGGSLTELTTLEDQYRLAKMYIASGQLPTRFKNPEQLITAMHFAREHFPETPITALREIAVINGTPCFFGGLPLALVQDSGLLEDMSETWEGDFKSDASRAICVVKRKGIKTEIRREFSVADAKRAGLWSGPTYTKYPQRMIQMRARSWALKDGFADVLSGLSIAEYDHHAIVENERVVGADEPNEADAVAEKYKNIAKKENLFEASESKT